MNYWDEEKTSQMNVGEITAFGMTSDTPEPVTAEVEDLRQFLGECTRGILDAIPQLPRPEARREAAQLMGTYAKNRAQLPGRPAIC